MPVKKKKKQQGILSKINFKSTKARGLLILISFAVIGGGVMVFRSFAATTVLESWTYDRSNNKLAAVAIQNCAATPIPEASKNNKPIFNLGCPAGSTGFARAESQGSFGVAGNYYRACAMIKGGGKALVILEGNVASPGFDAYPKPNGYTYFCDGTVKMRSTSAISARVQIGAGSAVNVSYITIERMAAPEVTPTAGPSTCEKNCTGGK